MRIKVFLHEIVDGSVSIELASFCKIDKEFDLSMIELLVSELEDSIEYFSQLECNQYYEIDLDWECVKEDSGRLGLELTFINCVKTPIREIHKEEG